ncbi:MAG: maleate cis-trans isomerase [Candidatus Poriferisodalaceae bacterium]
MISSNIALMWHLLRLAEVPDDIPRLGWLFGRQLAG